MKQLLQFSKDGTFTIVQFTDIHWKNGDEKDQKTKALMERVIQAEQPDLIVFTGDVIESEFCTNPEQSFRDAVATAEKSEIPWAAVFGNHDSEVNIKRERLLEIQMEHTYSYAANQAGISGFGNYVLPIIDQSGSGKIEALLYMLDSGDYSTHPNVDGYAWIKRDQIDWYCKQSQSFTQRNGGKPLPALAFFHIPLLEYQLVWDTHTCYGQKGERVCGSLVNSGMFAAMLEMGDVMGTFVGHDHINDYWGEMCGIRLTYGRATGYNTYGKEGFKRGARIIRLRQGERDFESVLHLDDGTVVAFQPEHEPGS
ncbi:metallophosphoesterase family protein [Paenibacillus sp. KN14-4R]|uniref:metallophosphoesterase family protein n=1 Tax=Paenibacillus sp. KN14-4R TaxID=3445773 RepID=UPI003F9F0DB5